MQTKLFFKIRFSFLVLLSIFFVLDGCREKEKYKSIAISIDGVSTINLDETQQLNATGVPIPPESEKKITSHVSWHATGAAVTISPSGVATGVNVGEAEVTATMGSLTSNSIKLTVKNPLKSIQTIVTSPVNSNPPIQIAHDQVQMQPHQTANFKAIGIYDNNKKIPITSVVEWQSSREDVAQFQASLSVEDQMQNGKQIESLKDGQSIITAKLNGVESHTKLIVGCPAPSVPIVTDNTWLLIVLNGNTSGTDYGKNAIVQCKLNKTDGTIYENSCKTVEIDPNFIPNPLQLRTFHTTAGQDFVFITNGKGIQRPDESKGLNKLVRCSIQKTGNVDGSMKFTGCKALDNVIRYQFGLDDEANGVVTEITDVSILSFKDYGFRALVGLRRSKTYDPNNNTDTSNLLAWGLTTFPFVSSTADIMTDRIIGLLHYSQDYTNPKPQWSNIGEIGGGGISLFSLNKNLCGDTIQDAKQSLIFLQRTGGLNPGRATQLENYFDQTTTSGLPINLSYKQESNQSKVYWGIDESNVFDSGLCMENQKAIVFSKFSPVNASDLKKTYFIEGRIQPVWQSMGPGGLEPIPSFLSVCETTDGFAYCSSGKVPCKNIKVAQHEPESPTEIIPIRTAGSDVFYIDSFIKNKLWKCNNLRLEGNMYTPHTMSCDNMTDQLNGVVGLPVELHDLRLVGMGVISRENVGGVSGTNSQQKDKKTKKKNPNKKETQKN